MMHGQKNIKLNNMEDTRNYFSALSSMKTANELL